MIRFREENIRWLSLELPDSVKFYKYAGDFAGEVEAIKKLLASDGLFDGLRRRLQIELVIAEGMSGDYLISFDGLLSRLRELGFPLVLELYADGSAVLAIFDQALLPTWDADSLLFSLNGRVLPFFYFNGSLRIQDGDSFLFFEKQ